MSNPSLSPPSKLDAKPEVLYGTAWKEALTEGCVFDAVKSGFRAIDTANQRKHYCEEDVGTALARVYGELGIRREDLFLQTKFTYARGQDHRKPYDEHAPLKTQVQQSLASSLQHLKTHYLDSYVLHGPSGAFGLMDSDWEVWTEMEAAYRAGKVKHLGISNVNFEQLVELHQRSRIKPTFVQNRCFAEEQWDKEIRMFCSENGIFYQGFSLLTANWKFLGGEIHRPADRSVPQLLFSESVAARPGVSQELQGIIQETGRTIPQIIFRFAKQIGIIPVVGTRSAAHMKLDLDIQDFVLTESQVETLENVAFLAPGAV